MLHFTPQSIFSWNFDVRGEKHAGQLTFNWFTEQGTVSYGGQAFDVVKHGIASGHWTLESSGEVQCDAQKSSPFFRSFTVRDSQSEWLLEAQSPFTRCYDISIAGEVVGTLCPLHPFTRRATLRCAAGLAETSQIFCFWLAALTWKRAAKNNH